MDDYKARPNYGRLTPMRLNTHEREDCNGCVRAITGDRVRLISAGGVTIAVYHPRCAQVFGNAVLGLFTHVELTRKRI